MFRNLFKNSKFFIFVLIITVLSPMPAFADNLEVNAESVILVDEHSGKVLFAKDENKKMFPASTTKILTAIIAMEYLEMDGLYVIGREINDIPLDSSKAGHKVNESILGINLIRGLIIPSGNETACVVAMQVAKKVSGKEDITYAEAEQIFSELMNKKAKELGANNSNFINPHGYHDENHYTTAYDMSLISREAMKNNTIKEIAKETSFKANGAGDKADDTLITQDYEWISHNLLLNNKDYKYPYATGIKTGFTNEAGDSISASASKDGKDFIAVIFKSEDPGRWVDAKNIFDYGFDKYNYETIIEKGGLVQEVQIDKPCLGEDEILKILSSEQFSELYSKEELSSITRYVEFNQELIVENEESNLATLKTPLKENESVGKIIYKLGDAEVFKEDIVSSRDVKKRSLKTDFDFYMNFLKENMFTSMAVPFWIILVGIVSGIVIVVMQVNKRRKSRDSYIK